MVEFVSYDGRYPNLCSGKLVLKINGEIREMPDYCLRSGGSVWFDKQWDEHVETGRWTVTVPDDLEEYAAEIENCVNSNIPYGCCGGCV